MASRSSPCLVVGSEPFGDWTIRTGSAGKMRALMLQVPRLVLAVLAAMLAPVVATGVAGPALAAAGTDQGPRAVDPIAQQARYQTLSAEWWQWAFSTPVEAGGPFDAGPVRLCGQPAGQRRLVPGRAVQRERHGGSELHG